jgi:AcrR family transcriptional regulator
MTEKQEDIINTALRLFALHGFDSTSTRAIAKTAGVSEGLIFRHFTNKEGLLAAIIENGLEKAHGYFVDVIAEQNPSERIKKALSLPFTIDEAEYNFWRLLYALKWQRGAYDTSSFVDFRCSLEEAFTQLEYVDPASEALLVEVFIDGLATEILLKTGINQSPLLEVILSKYQLNN